MLRVFRKRLALLLALAMVLSLMPQVAMAAEPTNPEETPVVGTEEVVPKTDTAPGETPIEEAGTEETASPVVASDSEALIASGTCGENLTWTLDNSGLLTISGTGNMDDYSYDTMPWYDYLSQIQSVIIETGVTGIGEFAFSSCSSLTSITIPDSVTSIGEYAFSNCSSLTSITLPASVTTIGGNAFSSCSSLTGIWVEENNPNYSSDESGVLFDKEQTTLIQAPGGIQGEYCIPEGVSSIGESAFEDCISLTSITIPDSVTSIGWSAFYNCSSLTSVSIPNGVTRIDSYTFRDCSNLTNVNIPEGVTSIGESAFEDCSSLTSITLPEGVTNIHSGAFSYCTSLTSINIPDSVTSIGDYAFSSCSSLTGIWVEENNPNYSSDESGVLFDKEKTTLIQAPGGIQGEYCIPEGVSSIGDGAFSDCRSLTSINIPDSVTSIGSRAFYQCSSLTSITLPDGLTSIDYGAFHGCSSLTSITIPDSVTSIGDYAFCDCSSLKRITFNGDAPSIGENAFSGVTATAVVCSENNETWTDDVLQNYGGTLTWIIRGNVTSLELVSEPETSYIVGDTIDLSGIVVRAGYDTGYYEDFTADELTVSDYDMSTAGRKTITISYSGMSVSFEIGVHEGKTTLLLEADSYPESAHNYANSTDDTQIVTIPGYDSIILVFSQETQVESSWDWIYVYDGSDQEIAKYTGTQAAGVTVTVPGDTAKIRLTSDSSATYYGYSFTSITGETLIHTGSAAGTAVEPTCTEPGRTAGKVCEICGKPFDYEKIPALGHDYADVVTPATPDEHGYITHTCTRCGDSYVEYTVYGSTTVASGDFSENLRWCLTEDGELYIFGEGAMDDFGEGTAPWHSLRSEITSVVMEEGVTSIGNYAFSNCSSLTSVTLPAGVTSIGSYAFRNCSSLTSITIPDSVTSIGYRGFSYCSSLTSITIPASVSSIDNFTFIGCSSLTSIHIPNSVTSIGDSAFANCTSLESIVLPDGLTMINGSVFNGCKNLTSIEIPETVSMIGGNAFANSGLIDVVIPDSVTTMQFGGAFENCKALEKVTIGSGVTTLTYKMFYGCSSLSNVSIPANVKSIGYDAFTGCAAQETDNDGFVTVDRWLVDYTGLGTDIIVPNGLIGIADQSFYNCDSLTSVTLPDSVTSIGRSAFSGCSSLTSITFDGNAPSFGADVFRSVTATAYYPVNDETWTVDVMQNYGGTITWELYYEILDGEDSQWSAEDGGELSVRADASIDKFEDVYVDGVLVDPANYDIMEGSTIVILHEDYLRSLGAGDHTVRINFTDGVAEASFTVQVAVTYKSASISLAGDIGVNYYVQLSDDIVADEGSYMQFTVAGQTQTIPVSQAVTDTEENGSVMYRFSCKVAAKQMTDTIVGQMYTSNGPVGASKEYSVRAYCDAAIKAYSENEAFASLVDLMRDMLNYGAYSQIQFAYNTENLANAGLEDTTLPELTADDLAAYAHGATGSEEGISISSVSLLLESTTTIRFYFKLDGTKTIDEYTFYVDGTAVTPVLYEENTYYVDKANVAAKDLDKMATVTVGGLTARYCGLSYVRQVAVLYPSNYGENLVNVAKALYAYNDAANTYFGA